MTKASGGDGSFRTTGPPGTHLYPKSGPEGTVLSGPLVQGSGYTLKAACLFPKLAAARILKNIFVPLVFHLVSVIIELGRSLFFPSLLPFTVK